MKRRAAVRMLGMVAVTLAGGLLSLQAQQASSAAKLSEKELAGKKMFLQRCSLCHLPALDEPEHPDPKPYGPKLNGFVKDSNAEAARAVIRNGSQRMPGFQYGLTAEEIENIIAYLKVFK